MSRIDENRTKLVKRYIITLTGSRDRPEGKRKRQEKKGNVGN